MDYLIKRVELLHDRIYITVHYQKDIIKAYIKYKYGCDFYNIDFVDFDSYPANTAVSFKKAIDRADSELPTIVMFSDIIVAEQIKWTGGDMVIISDSNELDICKIGFADGMFFVNSDRGTSDQFFGMVNISHTGHMKSVVQNHSVSDFSDYLEIYNKLFKFEPYKVGNVYDFGTLEKVEHVTD
jgi:hypothetical protein